MLLFGVSFSRIDTRSLSQARTHLIPNKLNVFLFFVLTQSDFEEHVYCRPVNSFSTCCTEEIGNFVETLDRALDI